MPLNILTMSIDKTDNIPIIIGNTNTFVVSIKNTSTDIRLYNLSLFLNLPDGMTLSTATLTQTSTVNNADGSSVYSWISIKDLAPNEAVYKFSVTVKCNNTFKNGTSVPFGYLFTNVSFKCQCDTMPRGDIDIGNEKVTVTQPMTFKTTRFSSIITTSGKVLKGAGTSKFLNDYTKVYTATCKVLNNAIQTSLVNLTILLQDGIRYIGNLTATGTDGSQFTSPLISTVLINNKKYIQLYFSGITLSKSSNTTITFSYAVWNQYDENQGIYIDHGTSMDMSCRMFSTEDSYESLFTFKAMDLIITTTTTAIIDVSQVFTYRYTYEVGQYYDISNIVVNYLIPDGIAYVSSSVTPVSASEDVPLKVYRLVYNFALAAKNSQNTVTITSKVNSFFKYKLDPLGVPLPVVSFDNFTAETNIAGYRLQTQVLVTDSASTSNSIKTPVISKNFIKGYYKNGTPKTITPLAPGDLAEYTLSYNATALNAIQRKISIDDFFPLAAGPIDSLSYIYTGYTPIGLTPLLIDPHGVDFYYGDIPGKSLSTINFKVPINSLGSPSSNINLMKLKAYNSDNISFSNRTQVTINIGTPNFTLTKTVTGPNVTAIKANEVYTYTVTISNTTNLGTETDAFYFKLIDNISSWVTLNQGSITVSGTGQYTNTVVGASTVEVNITKLAPGQSITLSYNVTVSSVIAPGLTITTTATNTNPYSQPDSNLQSNYQYENEIKTASATIKSKAITLTKTSNSAFFKVGGQIIYTLTVTVPEGTIAYSAYARDVLPSGNQGYGGSCSRNGVTITPSVSSNTITMPNEGTVDARSGDVVITYVFTVNVLNGIKPLNGFTSTDTNNGYFYYRQSPTSGLSSVSKNLVVTIYYPNLVLGLTASDRNNPYITSSNLNLNTNSIADFKLDFTNNSLIKLVNGIIEIPIDSKYLFQSINTTVLSSAVYDNVNKKIVVTVPSLDASNSGFITFTLLPINNAVAGTNIVTQATATQYYNDVSTTKVYGGEKSNIITGILAPGVSLLPSELDRRDDATSYRVTQPGSTVTINNYFTNTGGGYDDFVLKINSVALAYALYIDGVKIADVPANTLYQNSSLAQFTNCEPSAKRTITIVSTVPANSPLGARYDFVVTVTSKTSPYPTKTVLNIDPY